MAKSIKTEQEITDTLSNIVIMMSWSLNNRYSITLLTKNAQLYGNCVTAFLRER